MIESQSKEQTVEQEEEGTGLRRPSMQAAAASGCVT